MATTPEGKIKKRLDKVLKELAKAGPLWVYSPQAGPFGKAGVPDRLVLANGQLIGAECKANAYKKPTALQEREMEKIEAAGGICYLVFDDAGIEAVRLKVLDSFEKRPRK